MIKFQRHKTIDEIKQACAVAGFAINTDRYDTQGSDHVTILFAFEGKAYTVFYNTFNGRFFGVQPNGSRFDSGNAGLDDEPWFLELMTFVYVAAWPSASAKEG